MIRIVIADDSSTARLFIRRCLNLAGFDQTSITFATNGQEALEQVKNEGTDLLITDLNMPVMDGQELLKNVKSDPKISDLPVLVITSAANPAKESELLQMGASSVLCKPITPEALGPKIGFLFHKEG
ncbi:MAG: PleD family two-component system response regulator [Nitrospiria bacterium]